MKTDHVFHFLVLIAVAVALVSACSERRDTESGQAFFTAIDERFGVPTGKNPIDAETASRRTGSYRVETKDGKVVRVDKVNGHGKPIAEDPVRILEYDQGGSLRRIVFRDGGGGMLFTKDFSLWKTNPDGTRTVRVEEGGDLQEVRFNSEGFVIEMRSIDRAGNPTRTPIGRLIPDRAGNLRIQDDESFDTSQIGLPRVSKTVIRRDGAGNPVETSHWSVDDRPTYGMDTFFRSTGVFDSQGNEIETHLWDVEGKPAAGLAGWHRRVMEFDALGEPVGMAFFGKDGQPTPIAGILSSSGSGWTVEAAAPTGWRGERDAAGNLVREAWFDASGKPARNEDGIACTTIRHDDRGNILEKSHFDENGKPLRAGDGWATWRGRYDAEGNLCEVEFLGTNGEPVLSRGGMAKILYRHDSAGNTIEQTFFGIDGKPGTDSYGISKVTSVYDARGFDLGQEFFGPDGKPMVGPTGFAKVVCEVDAEGNVLEESFFGPDGRPFPLEGNFHGFMGHCKMARSYDAAGNIVEESFFDGEGKLYTTHYGFARRTARFDGSGHQIEEAYFDSDGNPVVLPDKVAQMPGPYGMKRQSHADVTMAPLRPVAKWTARHNGEGLVAERAFFDAEGKSLAIGEWGARRIFSYDPAGSIVEETVYRGDEKTTPRARLKYDAQGRLLEQTTFAPGGDTVLESWP